MVGKGQTGGSQEAGQETIHSEQEAGRGKEAGHKRHRRQEAVESPQQVFPSSPVLAAFAHKALVGQ